MEMQETDETAQNIGNNQKQQPISLTSNRTLYYSGFFVFLASLTVYFQIIRQEQQFKPYFDTTSLYPQSEPKIYAGQIHYSRIPVEYWEHRIQMVKAMGLNALSIYIMWNYHEIERGVFDFETGNRNLDLFLDLAQKYEMKVLIRPGPYVCAEWDFGGLPARLLSIEGLKIRSNNQKFLEQVQIYFQAVAPILIEHLWSVSDPKKCIIMLQIENEYGFFGTDINYILALREMWHRLHVITAEYYVDWFINIRKSHWPGANIGLNDAFTQFQIDYIKLTLENVGTVFGGQIYSGWLTHWHEDEMQKKDPHQKIKQFSYLMMHNISYSMYVVHGGTNFGLTAGANSAYRESKGFGGHVTSYDYDAPINQQGNVTQKYTVFREEIIKHADWAVPEIPNPIPMIKIPSQKPEVVGSLFHSLNFNQPFLKDKKFYPFESQQLQMFNQGIVLYRTRVPGNFSATYQIVVHDLGYLIIDGIFVKFLDRTISEHHSVTIKCENEKQCIVDLMVEAMGHDNYDLSMNEDFKGLLKFSSSEMKVQNLEWEMFRINIDNFLQITKFQTVPQNEKELINMTVLLKVEFPLDEVGDTYLNMTHFQKGYVWANSQNLGRYWNIGPQYKIFCPGVWLKGENKTNQIYILEMMYDGKGDKFAGELTLDKKETQ